MNTMTIPVAGVKRKIDDDASNVVANTNGPIYERNGLQICPKYQKKDSKTGPKKRINRRPRQASYFEKVIEEILATMDPKDHSMPDVTPPSPPTRFERTTNPKDNMMPSCAMRTPSPPTRFVITTNPKDNVMSSCAVRTPSPPPVLWKARHNNSSTASNVEELCRISDLKDVNIDYKKAEFQINSCNFFQRYVYPILARENPHATRKKVMDLAAAKWREFSSKNQHPNQSNETPLNADEGEEQDIKPTLPSITKLQERGIEVRPVRANEGRKQIIEPTSKISSTNQRDAVSERDGKQTLQQALRVCPLIPTFASPPPSFVFASSTNIYAEMPKTEEICSTFGLKDVNIDYTKAVTEETTRDFVSFNKFVRPKLLKENPWAPMGKILMLVAAKWREFLNTNPASGATKKPDLTKEPKPEEIRDKQPSRNWKRLINKSKKYRNINPHTNDEQKHASSTDLASQTAGVGKNSDEYCSRRLDDSISKLTISLKANCDAQSKCTTGLERFVKQLRATKIETSHGDSTSNRSSSASGIETQTACPEVSQKLARPILVEKNSQVLPEKSTFLDEVTGKRFIVRQKQTSGELPNYFVVTREQENVSKPSIILPPKSKSEIEDHSIIHNNRNTKRIIVRSSSSASALGDQFQSSPPSVKTEPEDETDRSNHAVDNDYENDTDSERENNTSSPNSFSVSGFNYLRRLVVNLAAQGEPKEEPEEDPNEELIEEEPKEEPKEEPREELEKEPKEEPQSFSEDSTDGRSEREDTVNTVDQNPRFLANADLRTTIVNRMNGNATHLSSESKIDNVPGQKGEDEYDVFGRWVAMKIRKMCSPLLKLQIENEISSLLLQKSAEDAGFSVICTSAMSTSGDETA